MTAFGTMFTCAVRAVATVNGGFVAALVLVFAAPAASAAERQTLVQEGDTVVMIPPKGGPLFANDYANATAMPLPLAAAAPSSPAAAAAAAAAAPVDPRALFGAPGRVAGGLGHGKKSPLRVAPARAPSEINVEEPVQPEDFGVTNRPFTTNRVDPSGDVITDSYPFRAAGRLFFQSDGMSFVCSGALIKPGIVVTAAHCVAELGQRIFHSDIEFIPAYTNGIAPYGVWKAARVRVKRSYLDGSARCSPAAPEVVCRNDIAIIRLEAQGGVYPGAATGWFGYGWNGDGFTSTGIAQITQLGYPVALDGGALMQRNESQGTVTPELADNILIGSLMSGGSSGGPWLVNLGIQPTLIGTGLGSDFARNVVVGVTSWGYIDTSVKEQGASPFTGGNIVPMVEAECAAFPTACSLSPPAP